jgi:hypothetical protein
VNATRPAAEAALANHVVTLHAAPNDPHFLGS